MTFVTANAMAADTMSFHKWFDIVFGLAVMGTVGVLIGLLIPGGAWREQKWVLTVKPDGTPANAITYGAFLGNVIDFVIVAFVVFMITKSLLKPADPAPPSKECPECKEIIPAAARKCRACASPV